MKPQSRSAIAGAILSGALSLWVLSRQSSTVDDVSTNVRLTAVSATIEPVAKVTAPLMAALKSLEKITADTPAHQGWSKGSLMAPQIFKTVRKLEPQEILEVSKMIKSGAHKSENILGLSTASQLESLVALISPRTILADPDLRKNTDLLCHAIVEIGAEDPSAAFSWITRTDLTEDTSRRLKDALAASQAAIDPVAALPFLITSAKSKYSDNWLQDNERMLVIPAGMERELARAIAEPKFNHYRKQITGYVLRANANRGGYSSFLESAVRFGLQDSEMRSYLQDNSIQYSLMASDPEETLAAIIALHPKTTVYAPVHNAMASWSRYQSEAASTFIKSIPPSPIRDRMVTGFIASINKGSTETTENWITEISDIELRERMTRRQASDPFANSEG